MPWTSLGESVAGTSHAARGVPCQDAFRVRPFGPGGEWLAVAVADGAGTASHADAGATRACDELIDRATAADPATLDGDTLAALFAAVRAGLLAEAERLGVRPRELACTALLVVAGPDATVVAQVGDGAVVLGNADALWVAVWPEPGEYANATDFLTDERFAAALRVKALGPVDELAVFTDGLQRLALNFADRAPHLPFFRPLFRELRAAADPEPLAGPFRTFLDSPTVNERTDDDKSLVLAVRRP